MEKEITLSEIRAVFTKDTDTFGKMDPFLEFKLAKATGKTQIADGAGKEPKWKATVKLVYFEDGIIKITALEDDKVSQDRLGEAELNTKSLKQSGDVECEVKDEDGKTGTIYFKYSVKNLPPTPILVVKNVTCDFLKETKFMLKTKPYFCISTNGTNISTDPNEEGNARLMQWNETLFSKIQKGKEISFNVHDKNESDSKVFGYSTSIDQFRVLSGHKKFNVIGKNFQPLGTLSFDFETKNFVDKAQSAKNEEEAKKSAEKLSDIKINKAVCKFKFDGEDIYFKFCLGSNYLKTDYIENAKKQFTKEINKSLYADSQQNKLVVAIFDKDLINDDYLGFGELALAGLVSGDSKIKMKNQKGEDIGDVILSIEKKVVDCKVVTLSEISIQIEEGNDWFGNSEPYVIGKIGGWTGRTETSSGIKIKFKKQIELKYSSQTEVKVEVWEEDLNNDDFLYEEVFQIANFKEENGTINRPINKSKEGKQCKGQISFKYNIKKSASQQEKNKSSSKKINQQANQDNKQIKDKANESQNQKQKVKQNENKGSQNVNQSMFGQEREKGDRSAERSLDNDSITRSRNTFKLPSIANSKNFGDRIFDKQSSATLQKSIHVYSMPKSNRFAYNTKYIGEPSYYVDTAFKPNSGKGVGFGFGNKKQFPEWMEKNMKENPAPGIYDRQTAPSDFRPKGPTFGISHKHYERVLIPKEKKEVSKQQRLKPIQ